MKRILITGAGSYIGGAVEAYLSRWPERYQVESLDLRGEDWKNASFGGFDAVFHVAALVHDAASRDDPSQWPRYQAVNTTLALETAQKAKDEGVGQFLFMSTAGVYGIDGKVGTPVVITRDTPTNPKNNYSRSKLEAEIGLQTLQTDGFQVVILRPPMIYGKGCKGNYVTLAKLARKMPVFPQVENQRSMLYVENFAEFVRLMVENGEQGIFCPQNGEFTNTSRMVKAIAQAHGRTLPLIPGFTWAIGLLGKVTSLAEKAFGNWCYDPSLSSYKEPYCVKSLPESILETELSSIEKAGEA